MQDVMARLWQGKWIILALTLSGLALGALVAALTPPAYRSTVVVTVAPVSEGLQSGASGGLGQLAALAGVSLGGASDRGEFLAYIRGRAFTTRFIEINDLSRRLFADRWDEAAAAWRTGEKIPTLEDAWVRFNRNVRSIEEDAFTGMISISIDAGDPQQAADWANGLVQLANEELRNRAREEAARSIEFLSNELQRADILDMRQTLFRLTESQMTKVMLANVRPDYAFRVVDPAMASDPGRFIRPRKLLTTVLGAILGLLSGCFLVETMNSFRRWRKPA